MKYKHNGIVLIIFMILALMAVPCVQADEYQAMQGVDSAAAVFDFSVSEPQKAAKYLELIQKTYEDANLRIDSKKPQFVVIFFGPATKLISKNRKDFAADQQQALDQIADSVSAMNQAGIRLEVCKIAVHAMGVAPETILPEIHQVANGWVSLIGYQSKGYALIPLI